MLIMFTISKSPTTLLIFHFGFNRDFMVVMAAVFIRDQPTFVELLGGQNNGKFISKTPINL